MLVYPSALRGIWGDEMRILIICASLVLALTQVGPASGADDNITALVRGCHVYVGDWGEPARSA